MPDPSPATDGAGSYANAVGTLRGLLPTFMANADAEASVHARDEVLARYGPVFSMDRIEALDPEEYRSFLLFRNNRHWTSLHRLGTATSNNMPRLVAGLQELLDNSKPLAKRYARALDMVPGMGKGLATAILTVAYPNQYGVWNNTSEAALRQLGIWPRFVHGDGPGGQYDKVNDLLLRLSHDVAVDLWTLDSLLWFVVYQQEAVVEQGAAPQPGIEVVADAGPERFALERHLEAFLVENWDRTPLGKEWKLYEADGDVEAGQQFPTDIGRIDILARHRREPRWLVVELKRGQTGDETVGQVLRYMGWVKANLAKDGDAVEGLIVAHGIQAGLQYAVTVAPAVQLMSYEVRFELRAVPAPGR